MTTNIALRAVVIICEEDAAEDTPITRIEVGGGKFVATRNLHYTVADAERAITAMSEPVIEALIYMNTKVDYSTMPEVPDDLDVPHHTQKAEAEPDKPTVTATEDGKYVTAGGMEITVH